MRKSSVILPFRFPGGKYYALSKLRPFWESVNHDEYREPFLGGGAVFWAKSKIRYNWLNDIDNELIFVLDFIKDSKNRDALLSLFADELEASKERHTLVKNSLPTNDLDRAYKFYYLNRTSFSGKMRNPAWGYRPKRSLPPWRWKERIIPCSEKLVDVILTSLDFQEIIQAPPLGNNVLMFLDPPYYKPKKNHHYIFSFSAYDHVRLCSLLHNSKYKFFLTYDDCPEIRTLYNWAYIYELAFFYRIDNARDNNNQRKIGNELVISNYSLDIPGKTNQLSFSFPGANKKEITTISHLPKEGVNKPVIEKVRSPIRFPGSKYQAIKFIEPFWRNVDHDEYREPFLGGGAIFFAKPLAKFNWLNDIDRELILTFQYMSDERKREILKSMVAKVQPSKELFYEFRYSKPNNDLETVFRYFVINRTAYSGIMHNPNWGYHETKSVQPYKWPERIQQAGEKLSHAKITNFDYKKIIRAPAKGNSVFLFIDPPYIKTDQKRAYSHSFSDNDHKELAKLLKNTKYSFCLTYDDCADARELYSWANIHEFSWRYHTANANTSSRKMGKELIITNY